MGFFRLKGQQHFGEIAYAQASSLSCRDLRQILSWTQVLREALGPVYAGGLCCCERFYLGLVRLPGFCHYNPQKSPCHCVGFIHVAASHSDDWNWADRVGDGANNWLKKQLHPTFTEMTETQDLRYESGIDPLIWLWGEKANMLIPKNYCFNLEKSLVFFNCKVIIIRIKSE